MTTLSQKPLVVLGGGGHGKVIAEILLANNDGLLGFVDDGADKTTVLGFPILGDVTWLQNNPCRVALGIGDNASRARLAQFCIDLGCALATAIHPRAVVSTTAVIEDGVVVMAGAVINSSAIIRRGSIINTGAIVEHDCVLEAFSHLSPNAVLGGGCRVGTLAHVGIGSTVLPRAAIGARSIVGGGSVVVRDIPANVVAIGAPARVTRQLANAVDDERDT